ncbi:MAG: glycosyltransferase family 2 protein [Nocardioidaceae bacterium]|nr:glycosyltransferase family 2 protein [Nocardioidaceae bacterium]
MQQPNVSGPGPEVSVVIPTRNRWRLLEARGLASALCQQDVSLEVVVVDDGSTDETPRRLASLNDDRVRTIRNERGTGVARARNSGMAAARGEWIAFLDDDDIWAPRKLRLQLDAAAQASADFVYGGVAHLDDELRVLATFAPPAPDRGHQALIAGISLPAGASNVLARRRCSTKSAASIPNCAASKTTSTGCGWPRWRRPPRWATCSWATSGTRGPRTSRTPPEWCHRFARTRDGPQRKPTSAPCSAWRAATCTGSRGSIAVRGIAGAQQRCTCAPRCRRVGRTTSCWVSSRSSASGGSG